MNLKLEFPIKKHKQFYYNHIKEWWNYENSIIAPSRLFYWDNFEDFLKAVTDDVINSNQWANAHLFFLIEECEIIWAIQIRHHINHPNLIEEWWHIWYWIAPKFRKKWYATKMLELWLIETKKLWLEKILITCNIDNIWSSKVILNNWWIFERLTKNWLKKRYWIDL